MQLNRWFNLLGFGLGLGGGSKAGVWIPFTTCLLFAGSLYAGLFQWLDGSEVSANRARFEAMDATAKNELIRKWHRFQALPEDRQEKYRAFHEKLNEEPNRDELKTVLDRYSNWLVTVSPTERARIKEANLDDAIAKIVEQRLQQSLRNAGLDDQTRLSTEDARRLLDWFRSVGGRRANWDFRPEDLDALQFGLSKEPRELMAKFEVGEIGIEGSNEPLGDVRMQLVQNWLRQIMFPIPNDQQMQEIYEDLSEKEKEAILELGGDPMAIRRKMIEYYHRRLGIDFRRGGQRMRTRRPDEDESDDRNNRPAGDPPSRPRPGFPPDEPPPEGPGGGPGPGPAGGPPPQESERTESERNGTGRFGNERSFDQRRQSESTSRDYRREPILPWDHPWNPIWSFPAATYPSSVFPNAPFAGSAFSGVTFPSSPLPLILLGTAN